METPVVSSILFWSPIVLGAWVMGLAVLSFHRLFLSPLASFPGPKLAALSKWYEGYYEIVCNGQFSREIDRMHDIYGPMVRVTPEEVHIRDSGFFDDVYMTNSRVKKHGWDLKFGNRHSTFTTADGSLHRRRRVALSPMFSRRAILSFVPTIREKVELLSSRVSEFQHSGKAINMTEAYPAFTGDIIMDYAFGFSYKHLESSEFASFHEAFTVLGITGHIATQFPWFFPVMNSIPEFIVQKMQPSLASVLRLKRDQWRLVANTLRGGKTYQSSHHTIFDEIIQSKLPPEDKTQQRLADEAQMIVGAGVETTAYALCIGTFHIVNSPHIYSRLHKELIQAIPDRSAAPDLEKVEKLPYLKACIQESLRLSYGLSARIPRVYDKPIQYKQWIMPAGTVIGMTYVDIHHDENIFPDSHSFVPERWLDDPKTSDGTPLEHFLVSFGRGPRSCLGVNVAYAELYLALGTLFRRYKFDLYETDVTDVEMAHDWFIPVVRLNSKGVRLLVSQSHDCMSEKVGDRVAIRASPECLSLRECLTYSETQHQRNSKRL
ncbi:Cytochrome P450 monooxygenase sdnE [Lachnellula suecica]|uniref:Cytochrome P450 monooxygenase sdnE n=1 Tax=Lachnellula suecica TaxID=602035 RepID=A0A8T9BVD1_9HELO|nr:Cytochrome P450 monooxygenase sdnE [Lachnellula suecica]